MRTRTAESVILDHIFRMMAVVLFMFDAQKHPLLKSTRFDEVWFLVVNDSHCDEYEDDEDEAAHNCSDGRSLDS